MSPLFWIPGVLSVQVPRSKEPVFSLEKSTEYVYLYHKESLLDLFWLLHELGGLVSVGVIFCRYQVFCGCVYIATYGLQSSPWMVITCFETPMHNPRAVQSHPDQAWVELAHSLSRSEARVECV